jgi:threonine dehydrogenase-like Zn-dependent dehydrogenase
MKEALVAIVLGMLDPMPLYTHRFALDQLPDAFNAITERPGDFVKGLLIL